MIKKTRFEIRCGFEFWLRLILNESPLENLFHNPSFALTNCKMRCYLLEMLGGVMHEVSSTMPGNS